MPNHITTIITADKEVVEDLLHFTTPEEIEAGRSQHEKRVKCRDELRAGGDFDFGALGEEDQASLLTSNHYEDPPAAYVDFDLVIPSPPDKDWYSWNTRNWGTKWNAYATELVEGGGVRFKTAWNHPFTVVVALSSKFPESTIEVKFADEDTSYNLGHYWIKGGHLVQHLEIHEGSTQAHKFALWVRYGQTLEQWLDEIGEDDPEWRSDAVQRMQEVDAKHGVAPNDPPILVVEEPAEVVADQPKALEASDG